MGNTREKSRTQPSGSPRDDVELESGFAQAKERRVRRLGDPSLVDERVVEVEEKPAEREGFVAVERGEGQHEEGWTLDRLWISEITLER